MNKHSAQLQWFLVSNCGFTLPLHQTMISLGREHCDVILKSPSADGKHAVITYDHYEKRFKVKDLNTINGTYVNDTRIPVHTFVILQHLDCLRFGFDAVIYQLQGISRIYSGPNLSHYNHSSTINNYYSPNISSSWTSPYISSPHLIINKMADCRNCECKQDVQKSKQQYIGNVGQSSREAAELFSPDSSKHSIRQDYCGNLVSQQGISHNNAVCNLSDANKRNQCIDGQISDPLKNGHCSLNSSPSECPQRTYSFNSLPIVNLQDESCASGDQCAEKIINSGTIVKSCHRRSASCDPISTEKSDFQTATRHQSLTECGPNSGKESIKEEEKINEMVVMKAEKPYVQSEAMTDRGTNGTEGANDGGGGGCRPLSTAFTIDFADNSQPTLSLKKLDIKDSISKFAPPKPECEMKAGHRRNLSLPKKENGKDGVWDLSNSYGLGPSKLQLKESLGPVRGGYLSEGHMSSDQDDELSAKSDPTRKANDKDMMKASCPVSTPRKIQELKAAKNVGRRSLPTTGLRDSAKYLISRMFGEVTAPPSSPSDPPIISPVGPVSKLTLNIGTNGVGSNLKKGDVKNNSRSSLTSTKTYTVDGRELGKSPTQAKANLTEVQVEELEGLEDEAEEDDDMKMEDENEQTYEDGSETGTYTIEKDGDNADEVKEARKNIDIVFGLKSQNANYEGESRSSPDMYDEKKNKVQTPSKPNSSWLKEWAASSGDIKTTQLPLVTSLMTQQEDIKPALTSTSTSWPHTISLPNPAPPFASSFSTSTTPEAPQRPRRRLPVIPTEKLNALPPSVHLNGMNSPKTGGEMTKGYSFSNRSSPEGGNPSDSAGMDTETILKETETVVSAMEARMDNQRLQQKNNDKMGGGRDSGGESDVDTSTASASNEVELRPKKLLLHKKVAAQLKSQLKSFEDDSCFEARSLSPRTLRRSLMGSVSSHGRTTPTDSVSEVETASVQSDISSSSELSGSSPVSKRKHRESAPLMRFNRAFSLRRARLGCESESSPVPSPATAVAKTPNLQHPSMSQSLANSRPSSANSVTSSKGRAVHSNKSDSGSSSSAAVKKSSSRPPPVSANNSFNRSDGGRFSLRLPRSAGPPPRPSSAKSPGTNSTPQPTPRVKSAGSSGRSNGTPRCNSTLSAKELELKNWKRRKEYDPLKAAAEGRKKEAVKKISIIPLVTKSESPSPTSTSFHRSASFHGTDALNGGGTHLRRNTFSLEDSEIELNSSDYHLDTPTQRHTMSDFEGEIPGVSLRSRGSRKSSEDELEATRTMSHTDLDVEPMTISPRDSPHMQSHPSIRHKNKVDALDNLVISTIYQLSCHLRGNAEQLLGKLRDSQKGEECLETKGLYEILERIALEDSPISSPQGRSVSKQLSGILKNLKRIEESLQIVDQVVLPAKNCQLKKHEGSTSSLHSHKKWNGFKDHEYY